MGSFRGWTGATVLLSATALAVGAVSPAAAANECANTDASCLASSALRNTNAVRAKRGKPPLTMGPASLLTNTVGHSKKLADNAGGYGDDLVHQKFPDIAAAADCGNAFFSAENLCMYAPYSEDGDITAQAITNLENSPPHLKNTLSEVDFVATGVYVDSKKAVWVTQVFGSWTDTTERRQCSAMDAGETFYGGGNDGGGNEEETAVPTSTLPVETPRVYPVETPSADPVETQPAYSVDVPVSTLAPSALLPLGTPCDNDSQCNMASGAYCRGGWETGAEGGVRARCRTFAAPCASCAADTMACWEGYECTPDAAGGGMCKATGDMEGRVNCDMPNGGGYNGDGNSAAGGNDDEGDAGSGDGGSGDNRSGDSRSGYYRSGSGVYIPGRSVYGSGVSPGTYGSVSTYQGGGRGARSRGYNTYRELAKMASGE